MDDILDSLLLQVKTELHLNQRVLDKVRDDQHERDSRQAYLKAKK